MMWGFIYEVMVAVWEGEREERLRQPEDVTLKYHQGDGCPRNNIREKYKKQLRKNDKSYLDCVCVC